MKIENWEIEKVVPYARNPRNNTGAVDKVKASLKEFGWQQPIVVDPEGVVIVGHTRLLASKELGLTTVPVHVADNLTAEQAKAYRIIDNKSSEFAEWDQELLDLELGELGDLPILEEFSFGKEEEIEVVEDDFESEPIEEIKTDIKHGDIIQIGPHRLMCGDSTELADVERLMDGATADLWLTDPPYNVDYTGKTEDALKVANDSMSDDDFREFLKKALGQAFSSMKAGASFYIFHADLEGYNFRGAVKDCLEEVRQCLIWLKQTLVMGRQDYQSKHEPCLYGWKKGASHFWNSDRKQTTILEFDRPTRSSEHPTMKPVNMFSHLINNSSKQSAVVLDTFLGSGTTMVACHQLKRVCYGMELENKYCDVIIRRMLKLDNTLEVTRNGVNETSKWASLCA